MESAFVTVVTILLLSTSPACGSESQDFAKAFRREYHNHDWIKRIVCGMAISYPERRNAYVYYDFALYQCEGARPPRYFRLGIRECTFDRRITFSMRYGDRQAIENVHHCQQNATQFIYSDDPDDQMNIWEHENLLCRHYSGKFYALYNNKFVSCKDGKYHFEACVFDTGVVLADGVNASQLNVSVHNKDICYQLGTQIGAPLDELYRKDPYTGIHGLDDPIHDIDEYKTKEYYKSRRPYAINNIQKFHQSVLCNKLQMKIVFYEFGFFECKNDKLVLLYCLYGDKTQDIGQVQKILYKESGDYIDDPNDLRFCGQIAHFFQKSGKSHEQTIMWKHEDFVCGLMRSDQKSSKLPYNKEPIHQLNKWRQYSMKITNEKFSGYGIYHNFQVMQCDPSDELPFLMGCLFDVSYFPLENAVDELRKNSRDMHENNRDFCFEVGRLSKSIKQSVIDRRIKRLEAGVKVDVKLKKWEENTIFYKIHSNVSSGERIRLKAAIDEYEKNTCLKFQRIYGNDTPKNYIDIVQTTKSLCYSLWRGMAQSPQTMTVGPRCNILYLLGLNIGLIDEFNRPDRDRWLSLNLNDLKVLDQPQFFTCSSHPAYQNEKYDYESIFGGSHNPYFMNVARLIKTYRFNIHGKVQATGLRYCDVAKINRLYECDSRKYLTRCNGLDGEIKHLASQIQRAVDLGIAN